MHSVHSVHMECSRCAQPSSLMNASCLLSLVEYSYKASNCSIVNIDDTSLYIWSIILSLLANLNNIHKSVLVRITGGIALGYWVVNRSEQ